MAWWGKEQEEEEELAVEKVRHQEGRGAGEVGVGWS